MKSMIGGAATIMAGIMAIIGSSFWLGCSGTHSELMLLGYLLIVAYGLGTMSVGYILIERGYL